MVMVDVVSQHPTSGPMAQVCQFGPKVGSHIALFCIHRVNRVNSRNDSESWWQHHKHYPGIILIVIIIISGNFCCILPNWGCKAKNRGYNCTPAQGCSCNPGFWLCTPSLARCNQRRTASEDEGASAATTTYRQLTDSISDAGCVVVVAVTGHSHAGESTPSRRGGGRMSEGVKVLPSLWLWLCVHCANNVISTSSFVGVDSMVTAPTRSGSFL